MAGKARTGQFGAPTGPYGGNVPVVRPADNVVTPTAQQQVADAAAANQSSLDTIFTQLKAAATT